MEICGEEKKKSYRGCWTATRPAVFWYVQVNAAARADAVREVDDGGVRARWRPEEGRRRGSGRG